VVVAVTAAILSCANGNASAVSSFFVRHIFPLVTGRFPKRSVQVARLASVCAVILSTAVALHTSSIVDFVVKFLPVTMSGLAVIILMGRFWSRANWQGALAALVTTPAVSLAVLFIPSQAKFWGYPAIPAVVAGALAQFIVGSLTSRNTRSFEDVAEAMSRERQAIENQSAGPTTNRTAEASANHPSTVNI
jgi:SSS family solute:Na+ symporter